MNVQSSPGRFKKHLLKLLIVAGLIGAAQPGFAANVIKADNADNLDLGTSWVGGVPPTDLDIGLWDSTVTAANTVLLGLDTNWMGVAISNPGGLVTIGAGNILTLGASGINMSAATQNFTVNAGVNLGTAQTWDVASGRTLTIGGVLNGVDVLTKAGAGQVTLAPLSANTTSGGWNVFGGTVLIGGAQALGQGAIGTGPITISNGATLTMNGYNSGSGTAWGTFANAVTVPVGGTGRLNLLGRGTISSPVTVLGTLTLGVS